MVPATLFGGHHFLATSHYLPDGLRTTLTDHPPPIGFLWLVTLVGACAVAVYLRVPVYVSWSGSHRRNRIFRVLVDGVAAGIIVGLVAMLFPVGREPTSEAIHLSDVVVWLAVLAVMGVVNAMLLYALSSIISSRRR
jgi:H+/Cl- antiporter ClcA